MNRTPWKVLVVDDDASVLRLMTVVLQSVRLDDRKVEVHSAASAAEARAVLSTDPRFAVAIIDVIMETEAAGLDLVDWMTAEPTVMATRMVVHSGQPAGTHERSVAQRHQIHDYWYKSAISATEMRSRLLFLLRSHRDILRARALGPVRHGPHPGELRLLAYTSEWCGQPREADLRSMTAQFGAFNAARDITGLMLVSGPRVLQFLEGEHETVGNLFERIQRDPRHTEIEVLRDCWTARRSFAGWGMKLVFEADLPGGRATPVLESIRAYTAGFRPSPGDFAQLLVSLVETSSIPSPPPEGTR